MSQDAGPSQDWIDMEAGVEIHAEATRRDIELSYRRGAFLTRTGTGTGTGTRSLIFPMTMVREPFRSVDRSSFTPEYVPIGPYHANHSCLRIEQMKLRSVDFLERRAGGGLARLVEALQPEARKHYRDDSVGREQLSRVLLQDGCYLLACTVDYGNGHGDDTASSSHHIDMAQAQGGEDDDDDNDDDVCSASVVRDTLFLMENQIPFFVLDRIHERVRLTQAGPPLQDIIEQYVREMLTESLYVSPDTPAILPERPAHLLHLVHSYFDPPPSPSQLLLQPQPGHRAWWRKAISLLLSWRRAAPAPAPEHTTTSSRTGRWRGATEYCKYGNVRFDCRVFPDAGERWTVLDVCLQLQGNCTLLIPRLQVDSMTWTVLRNLMALEEHMHMPHRPVTAYCVFMSQLASKLEDVQTLQRHGILEHFLASDEEVAQGFAHLCKGVVMDVDNPQRNYLKPIWHHLHERCKHKRNEGIGSFRHRHCGDPVKVAAFLIAAFLVICQFTQVVLALISVLQQGNH